MAEVHHILGAESALDRYGIPKTASIKDRIFGPLRQIMKNQPNPPVPKSLVPNQPGFPGMSKLPPPTKAVATGALLGTGIGITYGTMRALKSGDQANAQLQQ